jgi:hypothetical protein
VRTGESFRLKGQAYECVGSFEYEVPARWVSVIELQPLPGLWPRILVHRDAVADPEARVASPM